MEKEVEDGRNPRNIKVIFAQEIVTRFYKKEDAELALIDFEGRFRHGLLPSTIPENLHAEGDGLSIASVLKQAGLTASTTEALRMIEQGGVKLDGVKISDRTIKIRRNQTVLAQVGKRKFAKITIL